VTKTAELGGAPAKCTRSLQVPILIGRKALLYGPRLQIGPTSLLLMVGGAELLAIHALSLELVATGWEVCGLNRLHHDRILNLDVGILITSVAHEAVHWHLHSVAILAVQ
jgi:hypothetical protein